jgi:hypothetical protein
VTLPWASAGGSAGAVPEAQATPKADEQLASAPEEQPAATTEASASEASASTSEPADTAASSEPTPKPSTEAIVDELDHPAARGRVLHLCNFDKALKEITPSSSEQLGTLAEIRRWNDEFGEGRRARKKQVWGKDRFGFTNRWGREEDGRVLPQQQQQVPAVVAAERR